MKYKRCSKCGALKSVTEFYRHDLTADGLRPQCKSCVYIDTKNRRKHNPEKYKEYARLAKYKNTGAKPMSENKTCSQYLGVHVAERVLSHVFNNVEVMPYGNPGFDFICGKGYKIDVKSSILQTNYLERRCWKFTIKKNKVPDYFLLIAFDNREDLNPLHLWLIPGHVLNTKFGITLSISTLDKWKQYEKDIDNVIACCNTLKSDGPQSISISSRNSCRR